MLFHKSKTYQSITASMSIVLLWIFSGCNKLVEIDPPPSSVNQANVYADDATATNVLTGLYSIMGTGSSYCTGNVGISLFAGLSADEWTLQSGVTNTKFKAYYKNALSATQSLGTEYWEPLYKQVFTCNAAIEGLNNSSTLTTSVKQQLLGEAEFMRAFSYFYLVNMFGDVPMPLSTDYTVNAQLPRTDKSKIYDQIVSDLLDAESKLSANFLDGSLKIYSERVRPTKWAAAALLARVYLYKSDWVNAENQASIVINNTALFGLVSLNNVFLKNSQEAIWQLQPVITGHNTEDGWIFILPSGPNSSTSATSGHPVYLNTLLLNSFEIGDNRSVSGNWVKSVVASGGTYYYPYKYKSRTLNDPVTEYLMVLRLGEQYLIRAEARAQQNKIQEAIADLDKIRQRANLSLIAITNPGISQTALVAKILHERQVELFTEWGHRWFDLKRTNNIDVAMSSAATAKGSTWQSFQQLYPIPITEIEKDQRLTQNSGY